MKSYKKRVAVLGVLIGFLIALVGCGSGQDSKAKVEYQANNSSTSSSTAKSKDYPPDIHTNVPPPSSQNSKLLTEDSAKNFFELKKVYDSFSPALKERILQTYQLPVEQPVQDPVTDGGFDTLLGHTVPVLYTMSGDLPGKGCDPTSSFICLDSPTDGEVTVQPGVDVTGKIDLNQLAVFGADDPVAVISVFNNTSGGAVSEVSIMPADVKAASDPTLKDVGTFSAAIGLSGAGKYSIVVSAYKVTSTGNELVSILVNVVRLEAPKIEFVEAKPNPEDQFAPADKKTAPVADGATIKAQALDIKVKLLTVDAPGIVVKYEDFDDAGKLHSAVASEPQDTGERVGKVVLHPGLNKIVITAYSPAINQLLGKNAPAPSVINFKVTNAGGTPQIKILYPEKDGLMEQTVSNQQVDLQFCFTFLASQYVNSSATPAISQDCISGAVGFTPEVYLNGKKLDKSLMSFDTAQGIFTFHLSPSFGVNIYEIRATDTGGEATNVSGAFVFGNPVKIIEDGKIASFDTFSKRGLNIDIDKSMVEGDIKTMIVKFLNRPDTATMLLDNFKSTANKPGYVCSEYPDPNTGKPAQSNGDTTINFLKETFQLGSIQLQDFYTGSDGLLHVRVVINGMHGEADLRSAEPSGNTFNGMDLGFLPITFAIAKLDVNVGVAFPKKHDIDLNNDGQSEERSVLDIRKLGEDWLQITGDGPLGRPVYVNSNRNPLAAGIELLDWQQGLLLSQFNTIMGGTLLCGVENGLNNELSGALGKAVVDLEKLTGYNKNPFRLPMNFNLFGKDVGLDVAYNLLKGDIKFDSQGIHIRNVPLRFNPGPTQLTQLAKDYAEGVLGMVSRWKSQDEKSPQSNITTADHNLGLELSEDAINYALASAVWAGLLDLDLDANFYTENKIAPFSEYLRPLGSMFLTKSVDVNQDGDDKNDGNTPVLIRVRTDKNLPPILSFLSQEEVAEFVQKEEEANINNQATPGPSPSPGAEQQKKYFSPDGRYFKLTISGLDLSIYEEESKPSAGIQQYCKIPLPTTDNPELISNGFCKVDPAITAALIPFENLRNGYVCPDANIFEAPKGNGDIISHGPVEPTTKAPVPLYRVKGALFVIGQIERVHREIPVKDRLTLSNPVEKNILRIKLVPNNTGIDGAFFTALQVVENHTEKDDATLITNVRDLLNAAIGNDCQSFNEIKIPIPTKFPGDPAPGDPEPKDLLPDFDVKSLDLGGADPNHIPTVYLDESRLYLDILAYAGLNFTDEVVTGMITPVEGN